MLLRRDPTLRTATCYTIFEMSIRQVLTTSVAWASPHLIASMTRYFAPSEAFTRARPGFLLCHSLIWIAQKDARAEELGGEYKSSALAVASSDVIGQA